MNNIMKLIFSIFMVIYASAVIYYTTELEKSKCPKVVIDWRVYYMKFFGIFSVIVCLISLVNVISQMAQGQSGGGQTHLIILYIVLFSIPLILHYYAVITHRNDTIKNKCNYQVDLREGIYYFTLVHLAYFVVNFFMTMYLLNKHSKTINAMPEDPAQRKKYLEKVKLLLAKKHKSHRSRSSRSSGKSK